MIRSYVSGLRRRPFKRRLAAEPIVLFAAIGFLGFLVEAIVITALTHFGNLPAWQARIPSFLIAVSITWLLNRKFTFPGRGPASRAVEAVAYGAIQVGGAVINLALFGACLAYSSRLETMPVVPLAFGAVGGLGFNFTASKLLLYSRIRNSNGEI